MTACCSSTNSPAGYPRPLAPIGWAPSRRTPRCSSCVINWRSSAGKWAAAVQLPDRALPAAQPLCPASPVVFPPGSCRRRFSTGKRRLARRALDQGPPRPEPPRYRGDGRANLPPSQGERQVRRRRLSGQCLVEVGPQKSSKNLSAREIAKSASSLAAPRRATSRRSDTDLTSSHFA